MIKCNSLVSMNGVKVIDHYNERSTIYRKMRLVKYSIHSPLGKCGLRYIQKIDYQSGENDIIALYGKNQSVSGVERIRTLIKNMKVKMKNQSGKD